MSTISVDEKIETLKKAISEELQETRRMQNKLALKDSYSLSIPLFKEIASVDKDEEVLEAADPEFEDSVLYYRLELQGLDKDATIEEVREILPSEDDYDYKKIILRLIAELHKSNREINECLAEENLKEIDFLPFKQEIETNQRRIAILQELFIEEKEKEEVTEHTEKNRFIFVETNTGQPVALNEIRHIDDSYYKRFIALFDSIKDGTFKKLKRFTTTQIDLRGISEVKGYQTRVLISQIGPHEYAIISAFTKKTNRDKAYGEYIALRIAEFKRQEDYLKSRLESEEFLSQNANYQEELYKILGKTEEKGQVKEKVIPND